ncbi:Nipped-B-like protein [Cyphomyrmex costatus]|uniref:Nipped-B protein n=1 Tax=Cyphomyrmex costatus TaxID=456900 RepID=A0A195CRC5_9HYME|nr:Nipped-B-like protein [Cyphomyrmex costatus]
MNGVVPSVPITTLAGIASLTDLLPEMPLPTPLPQTLTNKSLLFHPRVAEEAQILLSVRDENLVPQLIMSLSQTSSEHIELKDNYPNTEQSLENEQDTPELLKAILQINPDVFRGTQHSSPRNWTQNISQMSPFAVPSPSPRGTVITEQTRTLTTPQHMQEDANCINPLSNVTLQPNMYSPAHMNSPNAPLASLTNMTPQHNMAGMTPQHNMHMTSPMRNVPLQQHQAMGMQQNLYDPMINQQVHHALGSSQSLDIDNSVQENQQFLLDSVTGLPDIDLPMDNIDTKQSVDHTMQHLLPASQTTSYPNVHATDMVNALDPAATSMAPNMQQHQQNNNSEKTIKLAGTERLKEPIVMLNRLSLADQALMQKSLAAFAEKSPSRAAKMGISNRDDALKTDSESEEEIGKNNKYFKARAKERQVQREKEKAERRKSDDKSRRRKRILDDDEEEDKRDASFSPVKPKIRKIEKKLVPVLAKLSVEELMETNTYQRFNSTIETIFENTEDFMTNAEMEDDGEVLAEMLIPKYQLHDLCTEAAKLKTLGAMESIPTDKLVRLLNILEKNIRDGARVSPLVDPDDDVDEGRLWMQLAMERVQRAVDASLIALHIMTSSNMPKTVYLEDVIDRIVLFMKFQLQNTIYPSFDPVYKIDTKNKTDNFNSNVRKKRGHTKEVREKSILQVYNKMHELVGLLAELLSIQVLTDTSVLHASSLGVAPFFVESVSDLQLSALKLVTVIFTKYEKHRRLLLDDILASIARLPSSKRSLRTYRLNSEDYIQMLTALVLQLIQCVVVLSDSKSKEDDEKRSSHVDADVFIINRYETATRIAGNFLTVFLNKCGNKGEEIDYRPLFENFVQDLLATVNKPEWPAAELLLSLLGNLLVGHFSNKSSDMSLRVASIDYLGVVAARLRKDAVSSQCKLSTIDQIIRDIKLEQQKDSDYDQVKDKEIIGLSEDEERTVFLQKVLLDYLAVNGTKDPALGYARHFYLAQWYRDCAMEKSRVELDEQDPDENDNNEQKNSEAYRIIEEKKKYIISRIKLSSTGTKPDILQTYIDYNSAELISQYLASKRPFSQSFDRYLKQILHVLTESSIAIRTKAMKCLTMIVEADSSVLARVDMQLGVKHSFLDHSTSVREAAVDLVGKFVLSRPELIDKYYDMLSARILDTGVSVRKRVIKILKDICMECPDFPKIPEICVKMIRRVNDEEGIRKLVMEVFQNMWFTPVRERPSLDTESLLRKVMNITDVVATSKDMGLEWFEQLLVSLFKPKEDKDDSTKMQTEPPRALELYHNLLTSELALIHMRIQVLNNIEVYLQEEEKRMIKQDLEWAKLSKQENLKEMGDVSSGMASTVIQLYIKEILESFLHVNVSVRHAALKVIQLILAQGLVHPVQIVPYLICMSTDCEKVVSHSADKQLQDIEKKYPGFIHMKSQFGIKLSYRLQQILQNDITRGMRTKEGEFPGALNGFLYTILRNTKQQRRAIVLSFLKHFDETAKTSLSQMLYLADNLAYFTYQVQDEPIFIIHHIDIIISMSGTNLLQSFKEALLPKENSGQPHQLLSALEDEEDDEEDEEAILARLPNNTTLLREYITASQGFLLLLTLRQHLKDLYGFSDAKIGQYSPSESAKVYEKAVNRKSNLLFEPKATLHRLREGVTNVDEELDAKGRKKLVKEYLDFKQLMLKFDPEEPDDDGNDAADTSGGGKHSAENLHMARISQRPEASGGRTIADGAVMGEAAALVIAAGQQQFHLPLQSNLTVSMEHPNNSVIVSPTATTTVGATTPRVPKLTIHTNPEARESHRKRESHRAHKADKSVRKHKKKKRRRISDSSESAEDCSDPDFLV